MNDQKIKQLLIAEFNRRIYEESIPRIEKCVDQLTDREIWYAQNPHINSIGNLILHLCGNVTQWMGSGLGSLKDTRKRDTEFSKERFMSASGLLHDLNKLKDITDPALRKFEQMDPGIMLKVQGFSESPVSIIIHVIEHFSYHTGQIAQMTKLLRETDLGFYAGIDLSGTPD